MSAATEQNNGDVAVEKVAANDDAKAVKEDLKSKAAVEETKAAADNGTATDGAEEPDYHPTSPRFLKGIKRHAESKTPESKKAKKDKNADGDSDEEEVLEEIIDSEIDSEEEYDIPYDDEVEGEDEDDDENDDGSGSDDQA